IIVIWRILRSFLSFFFNPFTSPSKRNFVIYPALTRIKPPPSKLSGSTDVRREPPARKSPIGSPNHQQVMPPTD
ncbi:hypothetical protein FO495_29230, partial [Bacillus tropicus]|nr:hypothetical protein [Bacillus tropicus]